MTKTEKEFTAGRKSAGGKTVHLQRIYIKDISFESPRAPEIFGMTWKPKLDLNISHQFQPLKNDLEESRLQITINAKIENKTVFGAEIVQAGIFQMQNLTAEEKDFVRNVTFPTALFPYAREAIDNLMVKASMPPIMLAQVNFEALFRQKKSPKDLTSNDLKTDPPKSRKIN